MFFGNDIDPGFLKEIDPGIYEKVSPVIEITKETDLTPHDQITRTEPSKDTLYNDKIEIPEWAKRQETTPFRADLGPTSTGDKLPDLGTTICHTGEVPSVFYDKTSGDTINIGDIDQSNH